MLGARVAAVDRHGPVAGEGRPSPRLRGARPDRRPLRGVLRTACAQAAIWSELPGLEDLRLSVNVFARQLATAALPGTVRGALADSGLAADRLTLELTESELLEAALAVEQLVEIADLGVRSRSTTSAPTTRRSPTFARCPSTR